jgi:hypothetical protein
MIYKKIGDFWKIYKRTSRAGRLGNRPRYKYYNQAFGRPPGALRVTVETTANPQIIVFSGARATTQEPQNIERTKEEEKRHEIQKIRKELQEDSTLVNTMLEEIAEHIQEGKIKIVSDGPYIETERAGTSASIIAINESKYLCV